MKELITELKNFIRELRQMNNRLVQSLEDLVDVLREIHKTIVGEDKEKDA